MSIDLNGLLKSKAINGWRLFWLISVPISLVIVIEMLVADISTGPGVSSMIGFSVRFAVPFIFLVVAASSVQFLFPGPFPMWWLRNRKYLGLCFAVAMAWQATFILIMSVFIGGIFPTMRIRRQLTTYSTGVVSSHSRREFRPGARSASKQRRGIHRRAARRSHQKYWAAPSSRSVFFYPGPACTGKNLLLLS